jgi:tRNA (guanine37-N1)-methyltransferase
MKIYLLTIFPGLFQPFLDESLIKKAQEKGLVEFELINIRDFAADRHHTVDDSPYGAGGGMVMKPEPIVGAFESIPQEIRDNAVVLLPSARGELLTQSLLMDFSMCENLIIVCGRYKDIDQRAIEIIGAREISIGNYVLQGGEIPAMAIIEGATRLLPDFLGDFDSADSDSFWEDTILSAPSYTRPAVFRGLEVPPVLLSGNHAEIDKWRIEQGKEITKKRRSDLLK